jgi:hypothetical protein
MHRLITRSEWEALSAERMLRAAGPLVPRHALVRAACLCAWSVVHLVCERDRAEAVRALTVAERWCRGEATTEEVRAASSAAAASAYAAYAAAASASASASASAYAASAAAAYAAAAYAASASASAAAALVRPLWPLIDDGQLARLATEDLAAHLYGRRHRRTGRVLSQGRLSTCAPDERDRIEAWAVRCDQALGVVTEAVLA